MALRLSVLIALAHYGYQTQQSEMGSRRDGGLVHSDDEMCKSALCAEDAKERRRKQERNKG